jgi:hypothetical protein
LNNNNNNNLLYINDLPQCLSKTKLRLFADDTNLTAAGESINDVEAAMNSDLDNLRKCLIANKLSLNVAKTKFILIGSKPMIKSISKTTKRYHRKHANQLNKFMIAKLLERLLTSIYLGGIILETIARK